MRIDAVMTCVGTLYQSFLLRSLPIWLDTLDSLTIATDRPMHLGIKSNLHVHVTTAFTADGAYLNKGKALTEAYGKANPQDWALSIDADIVPPTDWRLLAEQRARPDSINGAYRYDENGRHLDQRPPIRPKGYFQLWHTADPTFQRNPVFEIHHPHAAHYDTAFYEQWPIRKRHDLHFRLTHLGERSVNWFGVGADPMLTKRILRFCKA